MSIKETLKAIDWKNPDWESYKKAFLKPRPINPFPFYRPNKKDGEVEFASFSARMFAMTLDMILILIVFGGVLQEISAQMYPELSRPESYDRVIAMFTAVGQGNLTPQRLIHELSVIGIFNKLMFDHLLQLVVAAVYAVAFWQKWQKTPAMWLLRMYVADANGYGKPTLAQYINRYLMLIPSIILFTLGFLWIVFDKRSQGWHDKFAGTVVIQQPFSSWWKKREAPKTPPPAA